LPRQGKLAVQPCSLGGLIGWGRGGGGCSLILGDEFQPTVGMGAERACAVFFDEAEYLLGVGVGEDERAVQQEALARFFLFASWSAVALGEQFVHDVGAGVPVRHLDGEAFA